MLLPGQDNLCPSGPLSEAVSFGVSCGGSGLSEFGWSEIRKPQVAGSIPVAGSIVDFEGTALAPSELGLF